MFLKGEIDLKLLHISFIILLVVYSVTLLGFCAKSGRLLKTLLSSSLSGLFVMSVINLTTRFSGVDLAVNFWTVTGSMTFGIPGVLGLLVLRLFF